MISIQRIKQWCKLLHLLKKITGADCVEMVQFNQFANVLVASSDEGKFCSDYCFLDKLDRVNNITTSKHYISDYDQAITNYPLNSNYQPWGSIIAYNNNSNNQIHEEIMAIVSCIEEQIAIEFFSNSKLNSAYPNQNTTVNLQEVLYESFKANDKMKSLEEQLNMAMETGQVAYIEYNFEANNYTTTPYIEKLTGINIAQLKPNVLWLLSRVHKDDFVGLKDIYQDVKDGEDEVVEAEFRFLTTEQEYVWLSFTGRFIYDATRLKPISIGGIIQNVSNRKQLINELTEEKNKFLKANKAKSDFLANMSHEIRTPMNAILGFASILSKKVKDPQLQNYMSSIMASGKTLMSLINDLLDVSKIEADKMVLNEEPTDMIGLFIEIIKSFSIKANEKNIAIEFIPDLKFPNRLFLDELRIRQILLNLISNAVKYTNNGEVSIYLSYSKTSIDQGDIKILVKDTGIGIDEKVQKQIFDPFIQDKKQINNKAEGTGLGLAITNKLINLMGGKISLASQLGRGSVFTVLLPKIKEVDSVGKSVSVPVNNVQFNKETVLIVDDVASNRELLVAYTNQLNLTPILAINGEEAILHTVESKPAIVLMDLQMPIMDGFEAVKVIRNNPNIKNTPVIAVSAFTYTSERDSVIEAGFDDFIAKPVRDDILISTLNKYLYSANYVSEQDEMSEVEFISTLSNIRKEELRKLFEGKIIPLWEQLQLIQPSDKLKEFITELSLITEAYKWSELEAYKNTLGAALNTFDFETIQNQIHTFNKFINQLK